MARFRIKEPFVDAVKVSDALATADKGQIEPPWLLNAYNDGAVEFQDRRIVLRHAETTAYADDYIVFRWDSADGSGQIVGAMAADEFEKNYVPVEGAVDEAAAASGVATYSPSADIRERLDRHAEIGRSLQAIGGHLRGTSDGNEGPSLVDFGAELIKDQLPG